MFTFPVPQWPEGMITGKILFSPCRVVMGYLKLLGMTHEQTSQHVRNLQKQNMPGTGGMFGTLSSQLLVCPYRTSAIHIYVIFLALRFC